MPIEITGTQVATLRAFLGRDDDLLRPLLHEIPRTNEPDGTTIFLWAAFTEAAFRRFPDGNVADIIKFVAHARTRRRARNAPPIDPYAAEKLIITTLTGRDEAESLTDTQKAQHITLLSELVKDEQFTPDELQAFLSAAYQYAWRIAESR